MHDAIPLTWVNHSILRDNRFPCQEGWKTRLKKCNAGYHMVRQRKQTGLAVAINQTWLWHSSCTSTILVGYWDTHVCLVLPNSVCKMRGAVPGAFPIEFFTIHSAHSHHVSNKCLVLCKGAAASESWYQRTVLIFLSKMFRKPTSSKI